VGDIIEKGVVNMEGDDHRAARKMLTGASNVPNSRKLILVFQKKARQVSNLFDRAVKAEKNVEEAGTGVFAAVDTFQSFTLDIFGVVNLGEEFNHLDSITFDGAKKKETEHTDWTFPSGLRDRLRTRIAGRYAHVC
jgi:hypothetical protein